MLKRILIPICLIGSLALSGCGGQSQLVAEMGREWPKEPVIEDIQLTKEEVALMQKWDKESNGLVSKVKRQHDAYKAFYTQYKIERKKHNIEVVKGIAREAHWSEETLKEALDGQ